MSDSNPTKLDIQTSLLGIGAPRFDQNYIATNKLQDFSRSIGSRPKEKEKNNLNTNYVKIMLVTIVSAIIFILAVAIYDVIREIINNYYSKKIIEDPEYEATDKEKNREIIKERYSLISTIVFALVVLISAIVLIPIIICFLRKKD